MTSFFSSDPHFFHVNISKYCPNRPGNSVEEMNQILIDNINNKVGEKDELYLLGDILFCKKRDLEEKARATLGQIKCKNIYLIRGNHDYFCKYETFNKYFKWIKSYYELKVQDPESPNGKSRLITMCHFPLLTWHKAHRGSYMLHGHSHSSLDYLNRETTRLDVGVDAEFSNYEPLSYDEIKETMNKKEYVPVDHHGADL